MAVIEKHHLEKLNQDLINLIQERFEIATYDDIEWKH